MWRDDGLAVYRQARAGETVERFVAQTVLMTEIDVDETNTGQCGTLIFREPAWALSERSHDESPRSRAAVSDGSTFGTLGGARLRTATCFEYGAFRVAPRPSEAST
jgi:hypothetical protein